MKNFYHFDNRSYSYYQGPNNGPALLFIAGPHELWKFHLSLIKSFEQDYEVFAINLAGHESATQLKNYTYDSVGTPIANFIQNVIKRKTHIYAQSIGGHIGIWLAKHYRNWVDKLILENTPLFGTIFPRIQKDKQFIQFELTQKYLLKEKRNYLSYLNNSQHPIPHISISENNITKLMLLYGLKNSKNLLGKLVKFVLPKQYKNIIDVLPYVDNKFTANWLSGQFQQQFDPLDYLPNCNTNILVMHEIMLDEKYSSYGSMDYIDVTQLKKMVSHINFHRYKRTEKSPNKSIELNKEILHKFLQEQQSIDLYKERGEYSDQLTIAM